MTLEQLRLALESAKQHEAFKSIPDPEILVDIDSALILHDIDTLTIGKDTFTSKPVVVINVRTY